MDEKKGDRPVNHVVPAPANWVLHYLTRIPFLAPLIRVLFEFFSRSLPFLLALPPRRPFWEAFAAAHSGRPSPNWHRGSVDSAKAYARSQRQLLFVYLHADTHPDAPIFARDTLATQSVANALSGFTAWGDSIRNIAGYDMQARLRVTSYPYVAVLSPHGNQLTLLASHQGPFSADRLVSLLAEIQVSAGAMLAAMEQKAVAATQNRHLRSEQDVEYQQALEADRKLQAQQQIEEAAERERLAHLAAEQRERARLLQEAEARARARELARQNALELLPQEPAPGSDACEVVLRLPGGQRANRRFALDGPLQTIVTFAATLDLRGSDGEVLDSNDLQVDSPMNSRTCIHFLLFQLAIPFPRAVLLDLTQTLRARRFTAKETLFVEDRTAIPTSTNATSTASAAVPSNTTPTPLLTRALSAPGEKGSRPGSGTQSSPALSRSGSGGVRAMNQINARASPEKQENFTENKDAKLSVGVIIFWMQLCAPMTNMRVYTLKILVSV
jgi:hypothetical protein